MTNECDYPCPCCGEHEFEVLGEYDICSNCGWEYDPVQSREPNYAGGANKMSLNEARKAFKNGQKVK
ncbi:CPCC family cysteine-rich protein [Pectobacterium sp. CHL-2024]|uniref:CPCC family cysteine-rich protein n=1 Tax=Pectobacterium sp. CHL-2024 TaxID=3377079 RepID=UPI000DE53A89|nr:CPCC family cysteine-rich protein [Pectobacterium peruviense]